MNIIRNQHIEANHWLHLDDEAIVTNTAVSLSVPRWLQERETLALYPGPVAVRLNPEDDPACLLEDLPKLAMVVIVFPSFAEGRGYTQARRLRQHFNYPGEIRALNAHRDHLQFMERVGINAFELAPGENLEAALATLQQQRVYYQIQPKPNGAEPSWLQ